MVQFANFTKEESKDVDTIITRARELARRVGRASLTADPRSMRMDLAAVHAHTPLRLAELAEADVQNLTHDVFGIMSHLDRETGELRDCFVPRYAAKIAK